MLEEQAKSEKAPQGTPYAEATLFSQEACKRPLSSRSSNTQEQVRLLACASGVNHKLKLTKLLQTGLQTSLSAALTPSFLPL